MEGCCVLCSRVLQPRLAAVLLWLGITGSKEPRYLLSFSLGKRGLKSPAAFFTLCSGISIDMLWAGGRIVL